MEYTITLKNSGHHFSCQDDETLLDAALRQGVALSSGCRRGICGVCLGKLDSGTIHYADDEEPLAFFMLDDDEGDENGDENIDSAKTIVICEAIPTSDLVLDVQEINTEQGLEHKNLQAMISQQTALSEDVIGLELALPEDEYLQFLPGQVIHIVTANQEKLAFAPANAPQDGRSLSLHIDKRDQRNSQLQLANTTQTYFRVEGSSGKFFLNSESVRPLIFICEKTGFAAIKSMTEQIIARSNKNLMPKLYIYWLGEKETDLYQQPLAEIWANDNDSIDYTAVIGTEMVPKLLQHLSNDIEALSAFDIYINATANVVDEIEFELLSRSISPASVSYYRF